MSTPTKSHFAVLCLSGLLIACNNGSSSSSNTESIDGVTVQSVFPPNGATNIGLGEVIQFRLNKNISTSLIKQYISLSNSTTNSNENFRIIANDGTYDLIPIGGFKANTTYNFKINLPAPITPSNQSTSAGSYTMTTQPAYKIFVTSKVVEGNLGNPNTGQNSKQWADSLCNSDSARPSTTVTYKAMMGISDLRYACDSDEYCGANHDLDWVMQPNTAYYNVNGESVAITNPFATFDFPTLGVIKNADIKVWTGLNTKWINSNNCKDWTTRHDDQNGRVGWASQSDGRLIDLEKHACNKDRSLYCVQQPQAIISAPEVSPINSYMVTNLNSPIQVTFNSVNPINPATVTASTFTLTIESSTQPVAGTITSNGNNTFTFTPTSAYTPGKQYNVNLSAAILDNQGQPITQTSLFFYVRAQTKLLFMTQSDYWGDLGSIAGADSKCQADSRCPAGSTCKAVIMQSNTRYACTSPTSCGSVNSKDWVLQPGTTYLNTHGQIIATTNASATFGNSSGKFVFNFPIDGTGGHAWTGFDNFFMIKYKDGEPVTCRNWSIGDSGVNALGGLYGDARSIYPYAFTKDGGGCSKYTNEVDYGVYVDKQCRAEGGCSKRHLYCAQQ